MPTTNGILDWDRTAAQNKFTITLNMRSESEPTVRSCEVIAPHFRNRTSFGERATVRAVFVKSISDALTDCLGRLEGGNQVLSLPDFFIETPGLTLAGAHLMVRCDENGTLNVIVRFRLFAGGINNAFQPNIGFDSGLADETDRLAALVLSDLSLPVMNLIETIRTGLMDAAGTSSELGKALSDKSHEISFQIELIKRFVEGTHTHRFERPAVTGVMQSSPTPKLRLVHNRMN